MKMGVTIPMRDICTLGSYSRKPRNTLGLFLTGNYFSDITFAFMPTRLFQLLRVWRFWVIPPEVCCPLINDFYMEYAYYLLHFMDFLCGISRVLCCSTPLRSLWNTIKSSNINHWSFSYFLHMGNWGNHRPHFHTSLFGQNK